MSNCAWPLGNGQSLECNIYGSGTTWNQVAGIYIFAYQTDETHWRALYVGQTDDFSSRIPSHERWAEAVRLGATHVHATVVPTQADRNLLEQLLIQNMQAVMNNHYR
jgi:hypothetical protein